MSKEAMSELKDRISAERAAGNIVTRQMDELMAMSLADFVEQPADGILYDLNRSEEVVMTFIDDPKWINDMAVAQTIRKIVEQRNTARTARKALLESRAMCLAIMGSQNSLMSVLENDRAQTAADNFTAP